MLGLGNAISSGSSALDHLYSITLDGNDDYIDLGTGISLGTADFTISLWVKTADFHNKYFISEFVDAENRWFLHTNSVDPPQLHFVQEIENTAHTTYVDTSGNTNLDNLQNAWTHIAISADRNGNVIGYVNGVAGSTISGQATSLTTTANTFIGRYSSTYSAIQIDEVAIWSGENGALDSAAVTAIYNSGRPTNLTFDSGNYDNSSALVAYYRMGNGTFDDKANGVVHDQHAPGYGGELVNDGGFPTGTTAWLKDTGWSLGDGVANGNISGSLVFLYQENVGITSNKTYKANIEVKTRTSGSVNFYYFNGSSFINVASNLTLGPHTFYFTATGSPNGSIYIGTGSFVGSVTNVSVKQLNGLPGLTSNVDVPTAFSSDTP